jgi:hypothetical protein
LARALLLLAAGALLGLAVALPYDRLLGLPASTKSVLGAVVWFVLIGAFQADGLKDAVAWEEGPAGSDVHPHDATQVHPQTSCGILAFERSGAC